MVAGESYRSRIRSQTSLGAAADACFSPGGICDRLRDLTAVVPTFTANLTATINLLTALAEAPTPRLTMAGSLEEPDNLGQPPSSPYAASKAAAYSYSQMFESLYGISVVVPRVFLVYGPGQDDPKKLIPHVVSSLMRGEAPKLSSGTRPVDWVYVNDVAEGLAAAASLGKERRARRSRVGNACDDAHARGKDRGARPVHRPAHVRHPARSANGAGTGGRCGKIRPDDRLAPANLARRRPAKHRRMAPRRFTQDAGVIVSPQ